MSWSYREPPYRLAETSYKLPDDVVSRHVELKEQGRKIVARARREASEFRFAENIRNNPIPE